MSQTLDQFIRKLIATATPQEPVCFDFIVKKIGIASDILQNELNKMYESRIINRCQITKQGISQMVYWPTAIVDKPYNYHAMQSPIDKTLSPAPRRSEIAKPKPIKEPITMQNTKNDQPIVSKVEMMVQFIADNQSATAKQLADLIGEKYASNIPSRLEYLTHGQLQILDVIKNTQNPKHPIYTYRMAQGKTFQDYINRKLLSQAKVNKSEKTLEIEIPAFLRKETENIAENDSLQTIKINADNSPLKNEDFTADQVIKAPEFKIAITNHGTIILFGLEFMPIELSKYQTQALVSFINSADIEVMLV